jgi:effector-binding domain-containing protein
MIEAPCIVATAPQPVAMVRLCVPWAEMRHVMRPGLNEIAQAVAHQGIAATGPWFNHHFRQPTDTLDFAICMPVASDIRPVGRVETGLRPAMTVVRTVMYGDYAGLGAAWGELRTWIVAQGHRIRPEFWECYVVGPETSTNPANWRTEMNWPLTTE